MDQHGEVDDNDRRQAADLRTCVDGLETLEGERVRGASLLLFFADGERGRAELTGPCAVPPSLQRMRRASRCGASSST